MANSDVVEEEGRKLFTHLSYSSCGMKLVDALEVTSLSLA